MRTLTLDIVDYPGEWLLDLPLLDKSYEQWSAETLAQLRRTTRPPLPSAFLDRVAVDRSVRSGRRVCRDRSGAAVHRLSSGPPQGASDAQHDRPGPLSHARRSCGLAGADLRAADAAGRSGAAIRLGLGDDAAALRFLSRRRGAAVLPRSLRPHRPADRPGRCARRARRRPRGDARSSGRDGRGARLLPGRARRLAQRAVFAARRPHPVRRDQGRPVAPFRPRPAGGDPQAADRKRHRPRRRRRRRGRRDRARRRPRHPRGARSGRGRRPALDRRHRRAGRMVRRPAFRRRNRDGVLSRRSAG